MDEQDFKILRILCKNSRIPYERLGAEVGLPAESVINRIYRMWDVGVLSEYRISVNPMIFGMMTAVVMAEAYRSSCKQKDIRALRTMERFTSIVESTGRHYSVSLLYRDDRDLKAQVDAVRAKIIPSRVVSVLKPHEHMPSSLNLTAQEWRIIEYLLDDPRASVDKMSRDMDINLRTIERRLDRLISGSIITPTVVIQPGMFQGLTSFRLCILFNGGGKDIFPSLSASIKNQWNIVKLDSPDGVIVDVHGVSKSDLVDQIDAIKGMSGVKDISYNLPSRVISNDSLLKRKVIESIYCCDRSG